MATILYQDKDLIAVEKPEGLASIPEREPNKENALALFTETLGQKLFTVHRLDKDVSGVLLFAKHAEAHRWLNNLFFERKILKTYTALVHGRLDSAQGKIEAALRQFGSGRMGVDPIKGKPSVTEYEVLKEYSLSTLVKAHPLSGRRHQIRVHFYSLGHPIVGDPLYGDPTLQKKYPRLMLHAFRIEFDSPRGNRIVVESALPRVFIEGYE